MLTPGPGAFAENRNEEKNTFLNQKKSILEVREQASFLHPKNTRKPTFGASSRSDKSPWSYLANAEQQGLSTPGPMRYNPRLVSVATKAGSSGTFDDHMYKDFKSFKTYITDRQHSVVVKNFKDQTYSIKKLKDRFKRGRVAGDVDHQLLQDYKTKGSNFREYKVKRRPQSAAKAERFVEKSTVIKEPGSYLGPSDPATGAFGNALKTAIRINDERTLQLMKVRGELDKIKNNTKGYVDAKRTSTFGTSKRFVRKFPSRSGSNGVSYRRPKSSTGIRKKKKKVLESLYKLKTTDKTSNSAVAGIIEAMKYEAKLWAEDNPIDEILLNGNNDKKESTNNKKENQNDRKENINSNLRRQKKRQETFDKFKIRLHSRDYMLHKSVSQPSFCSPGFGTSSRFNAEKGTEQSFHDWMPGPGYYAKVVTGAKNEMKQNSNGGKIILQKMGRSVSATATGMTNNIITTRQDVEKALQKKQEYLRKRPGTFGKDKRESLSKLLNKWGAGIDVEGTPGPGDYDYIKNDSFADQIKTMNARCQLQEELKRQLMKGDIIENYVSNIKQNFNENSHSNSKFNTSGLPRGKRKNSKKQNLRPQSAMERYVQKEISLRPKTAGRLRNTYKMSYNDRRGTSKDLSYNRALSASSSRSRTEYKSPLSGLSHRSNKNSKHTNRPWTAGDERRIIGKPPNVDEEISKSSKKKKQRPSSMKVKSSKTNQMQNNDAYNWKGKFDLKLVSSYSKNDIVQFQQGLYMLTTSSTTGAPSLNSSGWVEYLKVANT
eukprot:g3927.t1